MLIEIGLNLFTNPPNISGVSQQNNIAAFSAMTEVDGHLFQNVRNNPKNSK